MLKNISLIKKLSYLVASLFVAAVLLSPAVKADDLNSKGDLCAGANLSVQTNGAGCNKTYDPNTNSYSETPDAQKVEPTFNRIATQVLNLISVIVGVAAVFMVIYGGFRFLTSAGNPESTKTGRNAILYALLGLLIVAFAQIIVKFILTKIA